jgi:hypothetical protein
VGFGNINKESVVSLATDSDSTESPKESSDNSSAVSGGITEQSGACVVTVNADPAPHGQLFRGAVRRVSDNIYRYPAAVVVVVDRWSAARRSLFSLTATATTKGGAGKQKKIRRSGIINKAVAGRFRTPLCSTEDTNCSAPWVAVSVVAAEGEKTVSTRHYHHNPRDY